MRIGVGSRRSLARLVAASLATAAVAAGAAATRPAAASAPPRCATRTLVVWLDTQGSGAAGSSFYQLEFTNLSRHACTLTGFPGVSAVDLAGRRVGRPASRDRARAAYRVRLAVGATAIAVLQIVDAYNFPRAACRLTTAAGLRVYPPDETASKLISFPFPACARPGVAYLRVQAVRRR